MRVISITLFALAIMLGIISIIVSNTGKRLPFMVCVCAEFMLLGAIVMRIIIGLIA